MNRKIPGKPSFSSIRFTFLYCLLGMLLVMNQARAQQFNFSTTERSEKHTAAMIKSHGFLDTITVYQAYWNDIQLNPNNWGSSMKFKSLRSFVKMYVDQGNRKKFNPYTYRLTYTLYGYTNPTDLTQFTTISDTLTIGYNGDSLTAYQDQQVKGYSNFHKISIVLTGLYSITAAGATPTSITPSALTNLNFIVEGTIQAQCYQKANYGTAYSPVTTAPTTAPNDYIPVSWNTAGTPAGYELEWTYVDDYKITPPSTTSVNISAANLQYDFRNNSTRVWLDTNYYRIPTIYQSGYIIYRVRAVRPDSVYYRYPVYSNWSISADNGTVGNLASGTNYFRVSTPHQSNKLNWQYTISFAEQGKYKHVLGYYDGLLKNRQNLTRFNSTPNRLLVAEQVYDYEGRPSIKLLPVPIIDSVFHYEQDMALSPFSGAYTAALFDTVRRLTCPGEIVPPPLATNSKGNIYYSGQNPDTANFQRYVPDAGGYPYVQTIFTPGNDKRVDAQGAAGDTLQIGRGHVTTNDYVSADQMDMNRLFGLNAGLSGFYRKTVTKDPNGQFSMNVEDYQGHPVASSMIGTGPDPLKHAITRNTNVPDSSYYNEDLLAGTQQQIIGNKRILDKDIYMDVAGFDTAQYIYQFLPYQIPVCPSKYLSVKADYKYTLIDQCGVTKISDHGTLGVTGVLSSASQAPNIGNKLTAALDQGKQSLHKELSVNRDEVYAAVDSFLYMPGNTCIKTEPEFIRDAVSAKTFPCPSENDDPCAKKRQKMMDELKPGAKYGAFHHINGNNVDGNNSVFTNLGTPEDTTMHRYQSSCLGLTLDTLHITKYGKTYTHLLSLPVDTFIYIYSGNAADIIAAALLPLHPEYCKLKNCFTDTFREKLMGIPDAITAEGLNLLKLDDIINADPLLGQLQTTLQYSSTAAHDSMAYLKNTTLRMDSLIILMAYCNCNDSVLFEQCKNKLFHDQIQSMDLSNAQVKAVYFSKLIPLYLSNRQRLVSSLTGSAIDTNCAPCVAPIRMHLLPKPVFVSFFNGNGTLDTSSNSSFFNDNTYSNYGSGVSINWNFIKYWMDLLNNSNNQDTLASAADSATLMYNLGNQAVGSAAADSIIARLVNCTPSNKLSDLKDSLLVLVNNGEVNFGNFTPAQVRHCMVACGITLNDLCNPYILNYDLLVPAASESADLNCKSDQFYDDAKTFLNGTAMSALIGAGSSSSGGNIGVSSVYNYTLSNVNAFEQQLIGVIGTNQASLKAIFNPSNNVYTLKVFSAFGGLDTANIFMRGRQMNGLALGSGCDNIFSSVTGVDTFRITKVSCVNELPQDATATGLVGTYVFRLDVQRATLFINQNCTLLGWTDKVVMNDINGDSQLDNCIPCTEIRRLYNDFMDTLQAYHVNGIDHPYYESMLRGFMNYNLSKVYSIDQYEHIITSCALADSLLMPNYVGYSTIKFSHPSDADGFITAFNNHDPNIQFGNQYCQKTFNDATIIMDLNQVPVNRLLEYKQFITDYPGPIMGVWSNTPYGNIVGTDKAGALLAPASATPVAIPLNTIFNSASPFSLDGPINCTIRVNGQDVPYVLYYIEKNAGIIPARISEGLYRIQNYINSNSLPYEMQAYYASTVDADYYTPEKQAYLKYVYKFQGQPMARVIDSLKPQYLQQRLSLYQNRMVTYGAPSAPGDIQNLYLSSIATNGGYYDTLNFVLNKVKAGLSGTVFLPSTANHATISTGQNKVIDVYRCADGTYWYRYFGYGDTLYNMFVKVPSYIPVTDHSNYQLDAIQSAPNGPGGRNFSLKVHSGGSSFTAPGQTDFPLAGNMILKNVVLANPVTAEIPAPDTTYNCERQLLEAAIYEGRMEYRTYFDTLRTNLRNSFYDYVMNNINEQLFLGYRDQRFNYTLYYYDRAGNLVSTVPPEGVKKLDNSLLLNVDAGRVTNSPTPDPTLFPQHTKASTYQYNTLNKVIDQRTPDGGEVQFFYDALSRPVFSQNDKQKASGFYTYTLYDKLNRVIETGQAKFGFPYFAPIWAATAPDLSAQAFLEYRPGSSSNPNPVFNSWWVSYPPFLKDIPTYNQDSMNSFIKRVRSYVRTDVVMTIYDTPATNLAQKNGMSVQENLRKRISSVKAFETLSPTDTAFGNYSYATHYSYDIAGNVKTITQDNPALDYLKQRYKRIDYDYDLVSGKINMLSYNRSFPDQFYQRYEYDDDNRITAVRSSQDGFIWKRDAAYSYYQHGPLARTSIGDLRIQGVDYAYTINGWLKSINGDLLNSGLEMGRDGGLDSLHANDAVATTLDYFAGDYRSVSHRPVTHLPQQLKKLYNGNIARQQTAIAPFSNLATTYTFDQLNRLLTADYSTVNNTNGATTATADYRNAYKYDQDGNILALSRVGQGNAAPIDSFTYRYLQGNNKLRNLTDVATQTTGNDVVNYTDSTSSRYLYDETGNTIKDLVSNQDEIKWNLYNKVTGTTNNAGSNTLRFMYDGMGNRFAKIFTKYKPNNGGYTTASEYYVRDAQGNILATYQQDNDYVTTTDIAVNVKTNLSPQIRNLVGTGRYISDFVLPVYGSDGGFVSGISPTVDALGDVQGYVPTDLHDLYSDYKNMAFAYRDVSSGLRSTWLASGQPSLGNIYLSALYDYYTHGFDPNSDGGIVSAPMLNTLINSEDENVRIAAWQTLWDSQITNGDMRGFRNTLMHAIGSYPPNQFFNPEDFNNTPAQLAQTFKPGTDPEPLTQALIDAGAISNLEFANFMEAVATDPNTAPMFSTYLYVTDKGSEQPYFSLTPQFDGPAPGVTVTLNDQIHDYFNSSPGYSDLLKKYTGTSLGMYSYYANPANYLTTAANNLGNTEFIDNAIVGIAGFDITQYINSANTRLGISLTPPTITNITTSQYHLAEHDIYGSSRLGVKTYWPQQYYSSWNYITSQLNPTVDSFTLGGRASWYSALYQDAISATQTQPWGNTETNALAFQHTLGQRQYEISNHLGNVLATVSDKHYGPGIVGDTLRQWEPSLVAAYDYYPFGMLMPGRYTQDTSSQSITTTETILIPHQVQVYEQYTDPSVVLTIPTGTVVFGTGGYAPNTWQTQLARSVYTVYFPLDVTPDVSQQVAFPVAYVDGGPYTGSVVQMSGTSETELASLVVNGSQDYNLTFTPHGTDPVYLKFNSTQRVTPGTVSLTYISNWKTVYTPQNVVVQIQNKNTDKYRYGFNGKFKDNEIAGTGNSLDFGARLYDSRVGRWLSVDPKVAKYPGISPYAFTANNPILLIDRDGREIWIVPRDGGEPIKYTPGMSYSGDRYVENVVNSLNYIVKNDADINDAIQNASGDGMRTEISYAPKPSNDHYNKNDGSIKWNDENGMTMKDKEGNITFRRSAALLLFHEVGHRDIHKNINPKVPFDTKAYTKEQMKIAKPKDGYSFPSSTEQKATEDYENKAAEKINENGGNESERKNYSAPSYTPMASPTDTKTTKEINK